MVLSHLETQQICVMAAVAKPLRALCNDRSLWAAEHVRVFGEAAADGADAAYLQRLLRRSEGAMEGWRQRPADENDLEFTGHVHGEGWGGGGGGEGGRRRGKEEGAVRALGAHDGLVASADGACVRLWSVEGARGSSRSRLRTAAPSSTAAASRASTSTPTSYCRAAATAPSTCERSRGGRD